MDAQEGEEKKGKDEDEKKMRKLLRRRWQGREGGGESTRVSSDQPPADSTFQGSEASSRMCS